MRVTDDRFTRDWRRYHVAFSMVQHSVRTTTIQQWTGLTPYRIQLMYRSYDGSRSRRRGSPPWRTAIFTQSLTHEMETSALANLLVTSRLTLGAEGWPATFPDVMRAEGIIEVYETYRAVLNTNWITLEHVLLLATELDANSTLALKTCTECRGIMVTDCLGTVRDRCAFCRSGVPVRPPASEIARLAPAENRRS